MFQSKSEKSYSFASWRETVQLTSSESWDLRTNRWLFFFRINYRNKSFDRKKSFVMNSEKKCCSTNTTSSWCGCEMDSLKTETHLKSFPACAWVVCCFRLPPLHSRLPSTVWQSALLCCLCGVVLWAQPSRSRSRAWKREKRPLCDWISFWAPRCLINENDPGAGSEAIVCAVTK